ncbi:disease resistance protein RPP13-like [Typha angustifolia]|uniref:disease resistance protein RPP13-like n=1 Tax=Typha angustifolia TaxID=59011 RepID=UPI003C2DC2FE
MAELALSSVANKIGGLLLQEGYFIHLVRDRVECMEREVRFMQSFMRDAECKRSGDERVKQWVKEIRNIAYDLEDVVDTYMLAVVSRRQWSGFISRYVLTPNLWIASHNAGMMINRIEIKIREITASKGNFAIMNIGEGGVMRPRPLLPYVGDGDVIGFDRDIDNIIHQLLDSTNAHRRVVSIVGTGGIGKTTLARKVYNSSRIAKHFDARVLLNVSQDYNHSDLLKRIARQIKREDLERFGGEELAIELRNCLKEKKYMIVLDDIWGSEVWEMMQAALPDNDNGSRVLITTRFLNVARIAGDRPYELPLLGDEKSLELLLKKASPDRDFASRCPEELVEVARQLAKRCGGLPLALVVVGGLLSVREKTHGAWLKLLETMSWQLEGKTCMDILALSYEDLPYNLKPCFLYLASFPEDYDMCAGTLIKIWVAEGFIPHEDETTMEDSAEAFLEELIQRCLIQPIKRRADGGVKTCRVHDLVRDLAISRAKEEGFLRVYDDPDDETPMPLIPVRRAAIHCCKSTIKISKLIVSEIVRSLLCFGVAAPSLSGTSFWLLRVIDLRGASDLEVLPAEIQRMMHLRYLGLRGTGLKDLPSFISNLPCLETLDVRNTHILALPPKIWKRKTLRHILFGDQYLVCAGPPPCSDLRNLQTLATIRSRSLWDKGLPNLANLRKLGIAKVSDYNAKLVSNLLLQLRELVSLTLEGYALPEYMNISDLGNNLRLQTLRLNGRLSGRPRRLDVSDFPARLAKLTLRWSRLDYDPMPVLGRLQCLRVLHLLARAYVGKELVCSAGRFGQLKSLKLAEMEVAKWEVEEGALPSVVEVVLDSCGLEVVPDLHHLKSLEKLVLYCMPNQFMSRIEKDVGEDWEKVQHVQHLDIWS